MSFINLSQDLRLCIDAYRGRYTPATREDRADQKVAQLMRFAEIQKMPARTLLGGLARQTPSFMKLNPSSRSYKQRRMIDLLERVEKQALAKIRESLHFLNREVKLLDCSDAELNALWKEIEQKKVERDNAWCNAFEVIVGDIFNDPAELMGEVFPNGQEGLTLAERAKAIRGRFRQDLEIPGRNNNLGLRDREFLLRPLVERFPDLFSDLLRTTSRADFDLVLRIYVKTGREEQVQSLLESNCTLSTNGLGQALMVSIHLEGGRGVSALILGSQRPLGDLSWILQMAINKKDWAIARLIVARPEEIVYPEGALFKKCMQHEAPEAQEIGWLLWASNRAQIDRSEIRAVLIPALQNKDEETMQKMMSRPDRMRQVSSVLVSFYEQEKNFKQALAYFGDTDPSCYNIECLFQCVKSTDPDLRQRALEILKEKEMKPADVAFLLCHSEDLELTKILFGRRLQLSTDHISCLWQDYKRRGNVEFLLLFVTQYPDLYENELGGIVKNAAEQGKWDFVEAVLKHPGGFWSEQWASSALEVCIRKLKTPEKAIELLSRKSLSFDPSALRAISDKVLSFNDPAWDPVLELIFSRLRVNSP